MTRRTPRLSSSPGLITGRFRVSPRGRLGLFLGLYAGVAACGAMPGAPGDPRLLSISGYVYAEGTVAAGEPALADALIMVQDRERAPYSTTTNSAGFYTLSVRAGNVSITASKVGFATRETTFDIANSTVLNFSLAPWSTADSI